MEASSLNSSFAPMSLATSRRSFVFVSQAGGASGAPGGWRVLVIALLVLATLLFTACAKSDSHALKGVVVEVFPEPPALLVDHEEVPGVMSAMTMKFGVDAATVSRVQKGQKIEGRMRFQDGTWRLEDVKVVAAP